MATIRAQIEDAVVKLLKQLAPEVRNVRPYAGDLAALELDELRRELGGGVPLILVRTMQGAVTDQRLDRRTASKTLRLEVTVVASSARSEQAGTRGAPRQVGAYAVLEAAEHLLMGAELKIDDVARVTWAAEEQVAETAAEFSIWRSHYEVQHTIRGTRPALEEFETFRAQMNLPSDDDQTENPLVIGDVTVGGSP